MLRFGRQYKGQILGEDQWTWLATTLQSSDAQVHIIISSIQVLTTNPVIESWGHFPHEKSRLFDLLKQTNPANLLLLSGDVHMAEMLYANYTYDDGSMGQWIEVTSSGLTHSCSDGLLTSFFCPLMNNVFSSHRYKTTVTTDSLYMKKNFGYLDIRYVKDDDREGDDSIDDRDNVDDHVSDSHYLDGRRHDYDSHWILNVSIISLEPSNQRKVMLSHLITINDNNNTINDTINNTINDTINDIHQSNMLSYSPKKIVDVKYGEFAYISPYYIFMICYILCLAVVSICLYINMRYISALKTKIHKLKTKRN